MISKETILDISLIVHGGSADILDCLESIMVGTTVPCRIMVVANTGMNPVIAKVERDFPTVEVVVREQPCGYAANHNWVIAHSSSPFVALLNDDLYIYPEALDKLVLFLQTHPESGLVGPRLLNPDGTLQPSTFGAPTTLKTVLNVLGISGFLLSNEKARSLITTMLRPWFPRLFARYWEHDQVTEAEILYGAALVARRAAIETIGPMVELTSAYGEEIDWHYRMRKAGWKLCLVPEAMVIHRGGQATGGSNTGAMLVESRKSVLHYFYTHRRRIDWQIVRCAIIVVHLLRWLASWFRTRGLRSQSSMRVHREIIQLAWRWPTHG